jgi:RimJ/RimL family protein N-acetyltransferase
VITLSPVTLEGHGVRLEPLTLAHEAGISAAASDGRLHELWWTAVPAADQTAQYIATANEGMAAGHMLPWAVIDAASGDVIGSTRFHDVVPAVDRVEIGYTFYAQRFQRSHVNTACKLLLLSHAFETVGCEVVGLRTDNFNFRSQRAIEGIGAKRDGIIRHHAPRRDGTARDTYIYSILLGEWPDVKRHLMTRLARNVAKR